MSCDELRAIEVQRERNPNLSGRIGLIAGLTGVFLLFVVAAVPMPFTIGLTPKQPHEQFTLQDFNKKAEPLRKAQLALPASHDTRDIAPSVKEESLGDPVYAAAHNACSGAVTRKYGNEWSTPGKFALTSQNVHEVWLFTGWRFTKKNLVVVCKYSVQSGRLELFEKFTGPSASK